MDNVYLADAAQQLMRTVSYEIPSMKRQLNKSRQLQEESASKEEAYLKSSADVRVQFERECQKLGIQVKRNESMDEGQSCFSLVQTFAPIWET